MAGIFSLFGTVFIDNEKANKSIDDTTKKGDTMGSKIGNAFTNIAKAGVIVGGVVVGATTLIGGMAVKTTTDIKQAMNSYASATGMAIEETDKYKGVLEKIYKNNYGENFQDIADSMSLVKTQISGLSDEELQKVTESALTLRDTFKYDVNESVRTVKQMMTQFGVTSDEAFNLIAQGAKNGLDKNGDMLDSINEYSVHFEQLGFDAEEMFNLLKAGADSGAYTVDKAGDAIKEFGIRTKDGSDKTKKAFKDIGLNADDISKKFAKGGDDAEQSFYKVYEGLVNLKDPMKQNEAGIALFGTMWEDLGSEAIFQIMEMGDEFNGLTDTMGKIKEIKYDDLGSMFEGAKRNVEMLVLPLGNSLMPILTNIISKVVDNMPAIQSGIEQLTPIIGGVIDVASIIFSKIYDASETILPPFIQFIKDIYNGFDDFIKVVNDLLPVMAGLLFIITTYELITKAAIITQGIMTAVIGGWTTVCGIATAVTTGFGVAIAFVTSPIGIVVIAIGVLIGIIVLLIQNWDKVKSVTMNVFGAIGDFIGRTVEGIKGAFSGIGPAFSNVFGSLVGIAKAPLNFLTDIVNNFIGSINKIKVPDWVPGVGGKAINIPLMKKLRVGLEYVSQEEEIVKVHKGEGVLTATENREYLQNKNKNNKNETINNVTLNIYTQNLDESEMERIVRVVNTKLGLAY